MELPIITESYSVNSFFVSDDNLRHSFNVLKKSNQQTKELNFYLFNQERDRIDVWLRKLEPHSARCATLKMKMPFCFSDQAMISASRSVYKLDKLKLLKVNAVGYVYIQSREISNKGLTSLSHTLTKLSRLTTLKLDFSRCSKITGQGLVTLGQCIYRLQNLSSMFLSFAGCEKIDNDSFIKFSEKLGHLSGLTQLTLVFSNCHEITDEGAIRLFQNLSRLTKLTRVTIKFYRCYFTDEALKVIGENLSKLVSLKKLSMTLSSAPKGITAAGTGALCQQLEKMQHLTGLTLKFGWCDSFDDDALHQMSRSVTKLQQLQNLQIGLYYSHEITDAGLDSLAENLERLKNLEYLKINLWACNRLTENAFQKVSWSASRLPALKKCHFASERSGWFSLDKRGVFHFALRQSAKKFVRNTLRNKGSVFLLFCLFWLVLCAFAFFMHNLLL